VPKVEDCAKRAIIFNIKIDNPALKSTGLKYTSTKISSQIECRINHNFSVLKALFRVRYWFHGEII